MDEYLKKEDILKYLETWFQRFGPRATLGDMKVLIGQIPSCEELPNEPLTAEEMKHMGGEPYYHVGLQEDSPPPHWVVLDPMLAPYIEDYGYGKRWLGYRSPPKSLPKIQKGE